MPVKASKLAAIIHQLNEQIDELDTEIELLKDDPNEAATVQALTEHRDKLIKKRNKAQSLFQQITTPAPTA